MVTAAHCIDGADEIIDYGFDLVFIVGENVISTSGIEDYAYIERMIDHPSYRGYDHDVGVVELIDRGARVNWMHPQQRATPLIEAARQKRVVCLYSFVRST